MRPDQMICPNCGAIAESDSVDIGVGLQVRGNFHCYACEWSMPQDLTPFVLIEDDDPFGVGA